VSEGKRLGTGAFLALTLAEFVKVGDRLFCAPDAQRRIFHPLQIRKRCLVSDRISETL
jgi:hypothetical protein